MDDFLSKPFDLQQLVAIFEKWIPEKSTASSFSVLEEENRTDDANSGLIDQSVLSALRDLQIEGKPDIFESIIQAYFSSSDPLVTEMQKALAGNDLEVLQSSAHSFKSSSGNVGAIKLYDLNKKLEMDCRNNMLENAADLVAAIELEYIRVKEALNREIHSTLTVS